MVDEKTLEAVLAFVLIYLGLFAVGVARARARLRSAPTSSSRRSRRSRRRGSTLGNVGPAFGFAGPLGSYEPLQRPLEGVMIALMWMGRVEIIPIIVLFTRQYWRA